MRLLYSRHLEHFLAVYEAGSLRRAAETSGVTQPALTKSLRVLEAAVGMSLFERHATGVVPTPAATILQRHAQQIVNSARYVNTELGWLRGGDMGALRVGCGIVWSVSRMPQLLAQLHVQFPRLEIVMHTGIAEQLVPRLLDGGLDVVFASITRLSLPAGYVTRRLPDFDMVVFARKDHPLARRRAVTLKQLAGYDFVGFLDDLDSQYRAELVFGVAGVPMPRMSLRSSSLDTLLATVAASDSLAILADVLAPRALDAGLTRLRLPAPVWQIGMGIMHHAHVTEWMPVRALLALASG